MRKQIRKRVAMLQQDHALRPETAPAPHAPQPMKLRSRPIIIEKEMYSDKKEGEYRMMQQQHRQHRGSLGSPLSTEFEEL